MEKELQLQPRLQCIASLVPQGARLADVGTDHGYLPVWLLQHGRIESAIASDINALPLDHARATAREYGVTERMDFRLCPGLAKIKAEECDAIAIAGMGGETIAQILADVYGEAWAELPRQQAVRRTAQQVADAAAAGTGLTLGKIDIVRFFLATRGLRACVQRVLR